MRPGRLTPENRTGGRNRAIRISRFNEAGAINPGKPSKNRPLRNRNRKCFNEAGAINPGKPTWKKSLSITLILGFNEAGAINPGKPNRAERLAELRRGLQ